MAGFAAPLDKIPSGSAGNRSKTTFFMVIALAAVTIAFLGAAFWVGYQGTDDGSYIDAALTWRDHFPLVGRSHWELRYPVIVVLDTAFWMFGVNVAAVGASMLACLFAVVALSIWILQRWFGAWESVIFVAIFCTLPGALVLSTVANADVPELFLVVASLAFYFSACRSFHSKWLLLGAGIAAGLAFATRETSIGLMIAYAILFVFVPGIPRRDYLFLASGFLAVVGLEMCYFFVQTGNPLWRFTLDVHHDSVDRSTALQVGKVIDREGNFSVGGPMGKFVAPVLVFLVTQKYGLVYYALLGSLAFLLCRAWTNRQTFILVTLGIVFLAWAGFVILNTGLLYLVPRYFLVNAWIASFVSAIALARLFETRTRLAAAILTTLLAASTVCLWVENTDPNRPSRVAVELAATSGKTVYTDAVTRRRGRFIAQLRGVTGRIRDGHPAVGTLYVLVPENLSRCESEHCSSYVPDRSTILRWRAVAQTAPSPPILGRALENSGLARIIPDQIFRKIARPGSDVFVYQVR